LLKIIVTLLAKKSSHDRVYHNQQHDPDKENHPQYIEEFEVQGHKPQYIVDKICWTKNSTFNLLYNITFNICFNHIYYLLFFI